MAKTVLRVLLSSFHPISVLQGTKLGASGICPLFSSPSPPGLAIFRKHSVQHIVHTDPVTVEWTGDERMACVMHVAKEAASHTSMCSVRGVLAWLCGKLAERFGIASFWPSDFVTPPPTPKPPFWYRACFQMSFSDSGSQFPALKCVG